MYLIDLTEKTKKNLTSGYNYWLLRAILNHAEIMFVKVGNMLKI